jgi:hypothetical protein
MKEASSQAKKATNIQIKAVLNINYLKINLLKKNS